MSKVQVERADIEKVGDALKKATEFLVHRDSMNAAVHLAGQIRLSPLTSELQSALDRIEGILDEN